MKEREPASERHPPQSELRCMFIYGCAVGKRAADVLGVTREKTCVTGCYDMIGEDTIRRNTSLPEPRLLSFEVDLRSNSSIGPFRHYVPGVTGDERVKRAPKHSVKRMALPPSSLGQVAIRTFSCAYSGIPPQPATGVAEDWACRSSPFPLDFNLLEWESSVSPS
jgi:hypothetical protein